MDHNRTAALGSSRRDNLRGVHNWQSPRIAFAADTGNRGGGDARLRRRWRTGLSLSARAPRLPPRCRSVCGRRLLITRTTEGDMSNFKDLYRGKLTTSEE